MPGTTNTDHATRREPPASREHGLALLRATRRDPLAVLTRLNREYGPVVRLRVPRVPVYLLSDPDAIQHALTRTHHEYTKGVNHRGDGDPTGPGVQPLARILGQGLLTSDAALHRRQRRLIQPIFHRTRIAEYADTFSKLADTTARRWPSGQTTDVHRQMTELTLAIIGRTVFDVDLDTALITAIRCAVADNQPALRRGGPLAPRWLHRLPSPANRRWNRAQSDLNALVYQLIAARRAAGGAGADVLSLLLAARDADTGEPMPDRQIRDEAMTLLLAGHETTANALAWALHLLATHPVEQARLHAETDTVLRGRTPSLSDLPALQYTAAVWRETLRLYPPAWIMVRRLVRQHTVDGYHLPAGSVLLLSPWVVHRDPQWWPEPDTFHPERWLSRPDTPPRHRFAYFPFGGGPRQCIGNEFADLEGILVLATVLRQRQLHPAPDGPPATPQPLVTLRPKHGIALTTTHRDR